MVFNSVLEIQLSIARGDITSMTIAHIT